jgi:hypothetical protein
MSALTTHTSNQFREKRKRKETKENLKQVIKCQTKANKISLEREKSRSPKARETARHNRDKMLQKLPTPQGEAKGLDTIGKRAQLKFRQKELPNA